MGLGEGDLHDKIYKSENLHFDNEHDIQSSSENYEENGYGHDLNVLIISH